MRRNSATCETTLISRNRRGRRSFYRAESAHLTNRATPALREKSRRNHHLGVTTEHPVDRALKRHRRDRTAAAVRIVDHGRDPEK